MVSVAEAEVQEAARERIKAVELGNSYSLETGDLVIAVGSPAGIVHSVKQGAVSYVAGNVQTADGQTRVLYTDCGCETGKGTFFLNMSGELVGWATGLYGAEDRQGFTIALPVSEYKGNLQKLMNGIQIPYMGLKGQDVSEAMQAEGIPKGLYITEAIADSPAYLARDPGRGYPDEDPGSGDLLHPGLPGMSGGPGGRDRGHSDGPENGTGRI